MGTKNTSAYLLLAAIGFWFFQPTGIFAQQNIPQSNPSPATTQKPALPAAGPIVQTPAGTPLAADDNQSELHGLQGVLVETIDGRTVATQNADVAFNPASAVKLGTALIALRTFGPQHRFATGIWTNGTLEKATGTINGNLYVSGRDPSLHYEDAVDIAEQLNKLGVRTVTGDLVVSTGFSLNFNWSARRSGEQFYDTFDSQLRSSEASEAWLTSRSASGDRTIPGAFPSVAVMGEVLVGPVAAGAKLLLTHSSSKLTDILKVLLCYSNNFMAERIGDTLGGVPSVRRQLGDLLGIPQDQIRLASLSGLGVNRLTPEVMLKILIALRIELQNNRLSLSDIMPVAGVDPGTLQDRFASLPWRGSVIAKTGTLIRTDGGASSLVGQLRTTSGEVLLFVIMNQDGSVSRFRENQDSFVMQIQSSRGGPKAFDYVPLTMAIKLTDTKNSFGSNDEYEPKVTVTHTVP